MGKIIEVTLLAREGDNLRGAHALVGISIGQSSHYSKSFKATIDNLKDSGIRACTFLVGDVLQRHNLRHHSDDESDVSLRERARELGSQWVRKHSKYMDVLRSCGIEVAILRWDDCICEAQYETRRAEVGELYATTTEAGQHFKAGIDGAVLMFVKRRAAKCKKPEHFKQDLVVASSTEYVIEECAVLANLGRTGKYDYFLYPEAELSAMRVTREHFLLSDYPTALRWVQILIKITTDARPEAAKEKQRMPHVLGESKFVDGGSASVAGGGAHSFFNGNGRVIAFMPDDADQELLRAEEVTLSTQSRNVRFSPK